MTRLLRQGSGQAYAEVIGDPIAQSKSPAIHGFWIERLGLEADYRHCHVRPEGLARRRQAINVCTASITMSCCASVMSGKRGSESACA